MYFLCKEKTIKLLVHPLSKFLVARPVAITAVDRFFSDDGPQMKRAKIRCRPYFQIAHNCKRTRSEDQFLLANFGAPYF